MKHSTTRRDPPGAPPGLSRDVAGARAEADPGECDAVILIPVFNDWAALAPLLADLDRVLGEQRLAARVLLLDDGSSEPMSEAVREFRPRAMARIDVLALRRNVGHQRALAIGLAYVESELPGRMVIVMDGDGEDAPSELPRLLGRMAELQHAAIVFAERTWRSERLAFRLSYRCYRLCHRLLTGTVIKVGNFSIVPRRLLHALVVVSDLWNHYPAAVYRARLPVSLVPTRRAPRLAGESRMNFTALVIHGLSAISVFGDRVGVRLLAGVVALAVLSVLGFGAWALPRFLGPGLEPWAVVAALSILSMLGQMLMVSLVFVFILLSRRESSAFLPARDYREFVAGFSALRAGVE